MRRKLVQIKNILLNNGSVESISSYYKAGLIFTLINYFLGVIFYDVLNLKYWITSLFVFPFLSLIKYFLYHYTGFAKPLKKTEEK